MPTGSEKGLNANAKEEEINKEIPKNRCFITNPPSQ
ncbi:hypothetical protein AYM02_08960 [Coxiella burnetii]|uniref:Uncharacterized protein n=2 Tax=Coxiella burnetii TaxID=777 RepID=Q83CH0_COXBU|nr:hypothetical protein CBU_1145 [Coxiella burnetii RSA 493]ACI23153.1 hypothetical protein CBUD_1241b [Coxiella burnetii Dugway 5J108-111]ACJ18245.1 hypothetical protein CbuG_0864 [Coxiella burnetii CbuG_Q212]AML49419.1 hypothetical protein AUR58_09775 [Coxiella burnetii]APQ67046.1 hypothetical protein A35_05125 [Coxiella burnetii 'MSU Goat Q177']